MKPGKLLCSALFVAASLGISGCGPTTPPATGSAPPPSAATTSNPSTAVSTPAAPAPSPEVRPTPTAARAQIQAPSAMLTVEEYPIVSNEVDMPTRLEYRQRIDPMVLEKRKQWREPAAAVRMARANDALINFGYRLSSTEQPGCPICVSFRLHRGDEMFVPDVSHFWPPVVSEDGKELAMLLEDRQGKGFLVQMDGISPWTPWEHAFVAPTLLGNDLLAVNQPQPGSCEVQKGTEVVYSFLPSQQRVDNPIKGLWAWQGHWALEVDGTVVIDGKSLNEEKGYDEVFGWRLLRGEPFYLFRKGGTIGVSYAGEVLPHAYDEVIHYQCCEPAAFNVAGNDDMVWFHALRGGKYYYVEMGRYEGIGGR